MANNHKRLLTTATVLLAVALTSSSCGYSSQSQKPKVNALTPDGTNASSYYEQSAITDAQGKYWIPLKPAVTSLGYRMKDDGSSDGYTKIGYSDVMYMLRPGSPQVFSLGEKITLPQAPRRQEGQIYITPLALSKFLQTEVGWNPQSGEINIATPSERKTIEKLSTVESTSESKSLRIQSISEADKKELVAFAKNFLGVPYDFGAGSYEETKKFDCSSFTKHVFKKFGVSLPRLAKDQDNLGTRVSRSELDVGDLIFFTVPGRFESDAIPGHVGIYIGDGKFIHTWGEPGVQISDLDSGYWSNVILHMQRVL
ncbi:MULTISPECIES: NlpC/P60 family protein [Paenibacillus]|uniref:C40 family peptidase n=1 Tax=Paenibacillus TaxID=44249 RepID=UPI00096EB62D|nr:MULTISPECIES: NlpC/P60 family protein [Paenibacillus]MDH6426854.1 cell wall-associated NlpC family hydrolase [Paenibacillus sp. PastH-4]MDH6442882.1 cell wall-associated NlpC family hydrolase [Paenibacillus sp. PastF-4]MDH6526410.1 cell wall-associated NlpC family hydrolase [Paenibacillus sp. PastH-3]OMD87617.1 cell wall hydrolase [Paenibacillus odorifer]